MPGYKILGDRSFELYLKETVYKSEITKVISQHGINPYSYSIPNKDDSNIEKKILIVVTPIQAANVVSFLNDLRTKESDLDNYHILMGLIVKGVTEDHIVMLHRSQSSKSNQNSESQDNQNQKPLYTIFDSKASDPDKFFSEDQSFQLGPFLKTLIRSIRPNRFQEISTISQVEATYIPLGTQSFFDKVSCGYHCAANLHTAFDILSDGQPLTRKELLKRTGNPVKGVADKIDAINDASNAKADTIKNNTRYFAFLKKAWHDTYLPFADEEQRKSSGFRHSFMGWPRSERVAAKVAYFLLLGFVIYPLINLIKLPTEFLLNAAAETAHYARNRLIAWAPTHTFTQLLRSGLLLISYALQGTFKAAALSIRLVTSPITSARALGLVLGSVMESSSKKMGQYEDNGLEREESGFFHIGDNDGSNENPIIANINSIKISNVAGTLFNRPQCQQTCAPQEEQKKRPEATSRAFGPT